MTLLMSPWLVEGSGGLRDILGRSYDKNYQVIHPASWVGPFYSVMRWIVNDALNQELGCCTTILAKEVIGGQLLAL
jgi:hypothetical protein